MGYGMSVCTLGENLEYDLPLDTWRTYAEFDADQSNTVDLYTDLITYCIHRHTTTSTRHICSCPLYGIPNTHGFFYQLHIFISAHRRHIKHRTASLQSGIWGGKIQLQVRTLYYEMCQILTSNVIIYFLFGSSDSLSSLVLL